MLSSLKEIRIAALDPDEPPLVFEWNDNVVAEFTAKILALPEDAVARPFPLPVPLTAQAFKHSLLVYVQSLVPGCRIIGGHDGTAGLACNQLQGLTATARLAQLDIHPWFAAVLLADPL
jgi:hypothetical protein